jgi:hypothetical protein
MMFEGVQLVGSEGLTENDPEFAGGFSSMQRLHYSAYCLKRDRIAHEIVEAVWNRQIMAPRLAKVKLRLPPRSATE